MDIVKKLNAFLGINSEQKEFTRYEKRDRVYNLRRLIDKYDFATTEKEELLMLANLIIYSFGTVDRQGFHEIFDSALNKIVQENKLRKQEITINDIDFSDLILEKKGTLFGFYKNEKY